MTTLSLMSLKTLALTTNTNSIITNPSTRSFSRYHPLFAASPNGDSSMTALELFESDSWRNTIKKDLDTVPIFCVANKEGKPIAYSITVKKPDAQDDDPPTTFQVPFFYTNIEDAKEELKKSKEANEDALANEMDLIPFPLGVAFELWAKDQAVIIPSAQSIQQAGAPPGTNPIGQSVPLFACMDIMQEMSTPEGKTVPVLPLFMVLEECNEAVDQAVEMDGGNADDFEVVSLSLTRAVEQLAANAAANTSGSSSTPGFQFIPPKSSMDYIQNYLADGDSSLSSPPP